MTLSRGRLPTAVLTMLLAGACAHPTAHPGPTGAVALKLPQLSVHVAADAPLGCAALARSTALRELPAAVPRLADPASADAARAVVSAARSDLAAAARTAMPALRGPLYAEATSLDQLQSAASLDADQARQLTATLVDTGRKVQTLCAFS